MAFQLTAKTRSILNQISKNPTVVLDIEGVDLILSSSVVFEKIRWDSGVTWDSDLSWDGQKNRDDVSKYINLRESTSTITQQIYPDKQGSSSITSFTISIIDKNSTPSKEMALEKINEIIGKKCELFLGFVGGNYPEDFMPLMNGIIVDYAYSGGSILMTISHVDTLRRQAILTEFNSQLTNSIDAVQTTIELNSIERLILPQDALRSYIKIDDEIIEVISNIGNTLTVIRGELNTLQVAHDNEADAKSVYRLQGTALDLAQKIMQSDAENSYFDSDINIKSFNFINNTTFIQNAIVFETIDIERSTGLISGDLLNLSTTGNLTIKSFGKLDTGDSYIVVDETLPTLAEVTETWQFKSQYNVLNFGLGMQPFELDNQEFQYIKNTFSTNFIDMDFRLESGIDNARDFINKELYFVSGCYGVPRNARSSVKFLSPPLSIERIPVLNEKNVLNMIDLKPTRSSNKFYYNSVLYSFDKSIIDGDFKSFTETINIDSFNRFNLGKKQLKLESDGFVRSTQTDLILNRLSSRFLDRYRQAATFIKDVQLPFKDGFNLQVGDVVIFGGQTSQLVDYNTGLRNLPVAKYEIINQKIDLKGVISIDILSTGFAIAGNFGVFSPSSLVATGSTSESLILRKINNLDEFDKDSDKWLDLIGVKISVRSPDFTVQEDVRLLGINPQNELAIDIEPLSFTPLDGYIVELSCYDKQDEFGDNDITDSMKIKYTFTMDQVEITSVISSQIFDVDDVTNLFEGQLINIHSVDFTRENENSIISSITGNTITLEDALDFTPQVGDKVEQKQYDDLDGYLYL